MIKIIPQARFVKVAATLPKGILCFTIEANFCYRYTFTYVRLLPDFETLRLTVIHLNVATLPPPPESGGPPGVAGMGDVGRG
jgi:hypothetical protein